MRSQQILSLESLLCVGLLFLIPFSTTTRVHGFVQTNPINPLSLQKQHQQRINSNSNTRPSSTILEATRVGRAQSLVQSLVTGANCYSTAAGAREFASECALDVVYEDRFMPQPIVGVEVSQ